MECIVPIFWSLSGKVRYQHFWKLEYRLCPDSDAMFHCRKCRDTFYSQSLPSFYRQVLRCEPYPFLVTSAIWHYAGRPRWSRCQPWTEDQAPSLPCPLQCIATLHCYSVPDWPLPLAPAPAADHPGAARGGGEEQPLAQGQAGNGGSVGDLPGQVISFSVG